VLGEVEKEGIETELVELSGSKIHGCLACRECSKKKDGDVRSATTRERLYRENAAADGILLGSPTYVTDVSPEIKALIDRACMVATPMAHVSPQGGAGVIAVRRPSHARVRHLNHFFLISEMIIPDRPTGISGSGARSARWKRTKKVSAP